MIFADGKGGKMEQIEKWCRVHKKACLVTGIMGLLLAPFLWPVFLAVIVQSLTIGLPIAAGICCYKYLNEKKENTNENEQKCHHAETKEFFLYLARLSRRNQLSFFQHFLIKHFRLSPT